MNRIRLPRPCLAAAWVAVLVLAVRDAQGQQVRPRAAPVAALNPATIVIQPLPATVLSLRARLSPLLTPSTRAWVQAEARLIAGQSLTSDAMLAIATNDISTRFAGQKMSPADVVAMAMIVMTQAAESAEADLSASMAAVKDANAIKGKGRGAASSGGSGTASLSDLGDAQQLRLQMYMDRRSKMYETLSNLMKRSSDASSSIIANLK